MWGILQDLWDIRVQLKHSHTHSFPQPHLTPQAVAVGRVDGSELEQESIGDIEEIPQTPPPTITPSHKRVRVIDWGAQMKK